MATDTAGETIRKARKAAGMTQVELAQAAGVSPGTVRAWESGVRTPHAVNVRAIEHVLGIKTADPYEAFLSRLPEEVKLFVAAVTGRLMSMTPEQRDAELTRLTRQVFGSDS